MLFRYQNYHHSFRPKPENRLKKQPLSDNKKNKFDHLFSENRRPIYFLIYAPSQSILIRLLLFLIIHLLPVILLNTLSILPEQGCSPYPISISASSYLLPKYNFLK